MSHGNTAPRHTSQSKFGFSSIVVAPIVIAKYMARIIPLDVALPVKESQDGKIKNIVVRLTLADPVGGQCRSGAINVGNYTLTGEAEVGGLPRSLGQKAKFEEYRDVPESVVVPQLKLMMDGKKEDYYLNVDAIKVGRNDQNYSLRVGRYGLLDVEFEWDQIPHFFNEDTAATPFRSRDGTFTLSSKPTNAGDCPSDPTVSGWVNGCSHGIDLGLLHGFAKVKLRYTPTPGWTLMPVIHPRMSPATGPSARVPMRSPTWLSSPNPSTIRYTM